MVHSGAGRGDESDVATAAAGALPSAPSLDPTDARDLLALAFEHSPLGMTLTLLPAPSLNGHRPRAFMINKAFADMLGYSVEELLTVEDQSLFTVEDDRASDLAAVRNLVAGHERVAHWDKRYRHADGHIVWG